MTYDWKGVLKGHYHWKNIYNGLKEWKPEAPWYQILWWTINFPHVHTECDDE